MAILITGATGFVGSRLVPFLSEKGYEIVEFSGDIARREDTRNFTTNKKIEAVIHLAAVINAKKRDIFQVVNAEGTKNIINLSCRLRAGRLVFLSSIRILSASRDPYIDSKKEAEKAVLNSGLPYIILRPSMVYGPGDKKNISFLLKYAKIMPMAPVLNFRMQLIFLEDLIRIIEAALHCPANTTLNIVGPEILSFKEILRIIKKQSKKKFLIINCPRFFNWLLRALACLPFFPLPRWQIQTLLSDEVYQGDDWQKLLGLEATPFVEGLRRTLI